jgi:methionyl aminopeptidase
VKLKSPDEIALMRESAQLVSKTLGLLATEIKPGATGLHLDRLAEEFIRDNGGIPGFKGLYGFPNTLCLSLNEMVVHGIPSDRPFAEGDIVSVDCGVVLNGFYGDHAYTFEVGTVSEDTRKLLRVTKESLYIGIDKMRQGNRVNDIGNAIQKHAESHGYGVIRELVGHGLGRELHEEPQVPNYGKRGTGKLLQDGLVLAIEPMINLGKKEVFTDADGWTVRTKDGSISAHFEHDVCVRKDKAEILSNYQPIEAAEQKNPNLFTND